VGLSDIFAGVILRFIGWGLRVPYLIFTRWAGRKFSLGRERVFVRGPLC
jgi:hypothetical protein